MSSSPIRTFIVDDHPAMRAGVAAVLNQEEDIAVVGAATGGRQLWRTLPTTDPDVDERTGGRRSPRGRRLRPG